MAKEASGWGFQDRFKFLGDTDSDRKSLSGDFLKFNFDKIGTWSLDKNEDTGLY